MTELNPIEKRIILNFLPYEETVPKGLDPTFYHTLNYDSEVRLQNQINEIRRKLSDGVS